MNGEESPIRLSKSELARRHQINRQRYGHAVLRNVTDSDTEAAYEPLLLDITVPSSMKIELARQRKYARIELQETKVSLRGGILDLVEKRTQGREAKFEYEGPWDNLAALEFRVFDDSSDSLETAKTFADQLAKILYGEVKSTTILTRDLPMAPRQKT